MKLKIDFFKQKLLFMLCFLALSNFAFAQRTISGTVTDDSGETLVGASVVATGTASGTVTDLDGKYKLEIPEGVIELTFSFVGFTAQTLAIGSADVMDVSLAEGTVLDEMVVVGYGTVKRTNTTGAVVGVGEKDFNRGVVSSPEELIQGRAAGVQITSASGEPGAGVSIRIRGASSMRNGNNPLFVVDGVPLGGGNVSGEVQSNIQLGNSSAKNPLNFLNPSDIESIDILKDASATAIYGSRGANGVVIITTKSGKGEKGSLDYGYSIGFSSITQKYDLLSASEYLDAYASFNGADAAATLNGGTSTDWQDEILRTGVTHNHNVSFGGSGQGSNYRVSLSYMDQEGIILESGLQRLTGRFSGSKSFLDDRLTISTSFTVGNTHDDNVPISDNSGFTGDLLGSALKANPTQPVRNADGSLNQLSETESNPVAMLELSDDITNTLRALGNINATLKITDELSFKTLVGFDRSFSNRRTAYSPDLVAAGIVGRGRLFISDQETNDKLWENYFTYDKDFGDINFTGLLGYSYQQFESVGRSFEATNIRESDPQLILASVNTVDIRAGNSLIPRSGFNTIDELQSFFGRVNFGIKDKYLLEASLRADGSTRFGSGNQYGIFPAFSAKWRMSEEDFIPESIPELALRIGYGVTGNQEIPHNQFQPRQQYNGYTLNEGGNVGGGNFGNVSFENPNLKWESTTSLNVGLDFALFDYKVTGSVDWYRKNTNDLLVSVAQAQPAPQPFAWENLDAEVVNTGLEIALNIEAVNSGDFRWTITPNIAFNDNKVENFGGLINTGEINGQGLTGAFAQRIADGQPLYAYFLREFVGFDDNGISVYGEGDFQKFTGESPIPTTTMGLTNSISYKNLDFSFFFTGQYGHHIYSNTANAYFTAGALANGRNVTRDVVGNGESNLNAPDVSTRFLEKGDFTRLQNVSLGYTFNTEGSVFSSVRLYATGQNLFVLTEYSGQDPEVDTPKSLNGVPSFGIDYTPFPRARTFVFGANVSF